MWSNVGTGLGTLWLLAIVTAGAAPAAPAAQGEADVVRAERILNANCLSCHNVRAVETAAYDHAGWEKVVKAEIARGAKVAPEDVPVLVDYLALQHGPVPDGPGREILLNTCTMCHDLKRIKLGRRSTEEWEETLITMLNEGAPLSDDHFPIIHAYLSRHFNVQ
jgi:cytochrome c5